MKLTINGQSRELDQILDGSTVSEVIHALGFKPDRVAVEHNGYISPRAGWGEALIQSGDRLEVVHFVGGGC